jgi:membrane protease subunit HflK
MPWNEPGRDKDPWNGKNKNQTSNGVDDLFDKLTGLFGGSKKKDGGGGNSSGIVILVIIALMVWAFTGFYTIDERERGVVLRFGAFSEVTKAGLHWHIPYPVEVVEVVDVDSTRTAKERKVMLTNDENIVDLAVSVQYKINNVQDYLFNVANADNVNSQTGSTLHQVMRSAIREVVGRNSMDSIIKDGREQIAQDTSTVMQTILDQYKAGIVVNKVNLTYAEAPEQVKDAFDDANRAREDMNRYRNEALAYEKKVVPAARGRAARVTEEAEGYKARIIAEAEGESSRFEQLMVEYQKAPEVTRQRLYLETIEEVLGKTQKVIVDAKSGNNIMMLPIGAGNAKNTSSISPETINKAIDAAAAKKATELLQSRSTTRTSGREARTLGGQ